MGIGFRELIVILIIALVLFGAKRLKTIGTDLGAAVRGFKKALGEGEVEGHKQARDFQRQLSEPSQQTAQHGHKSQMSEQVG